MSKRQTQAQWGTDYLVRDRADQRMPSLGQVKVLNGPKQFVGLVGDVIGFRTLSCLSTTNGETYNGLDHNCVVVRLLPDMAKKNYSYIIHLLEGSVEYINENEDQ